MLLDEIGLHHVQGFSRALHSRLKDRETGFGKDYLRLLVDDATVTDKEVLGRGSYAKLAGAVLEGEGSWVPGFGAQFCT